jgi:hypothetical protein
MAAGRLTFKNSLEACYLAVLLPPKLQAGVRLSLVLMEVDLELLAVVLRCVRLAVL